MSKYIWSKKSLRCLRCSANRCHRYARNTPNSQRWEYTKCFSRKIDDVWILSTIRTIISIYDYPCSPCRDIQILSKCYITDSCRESILWEKITICSVSSVETIRVVCRLFRKCISPYRSRKEEKQEKRPSSKERKNHTYIVWFFRNFANGRRRKYTIPLYLLMTRLHLLLQWYLWLSRS